MIEAIIHWSLKNRFLVACAALLLIALGVRAIYLTPVDAIPDLTENQVLVYADWPGRGPQEVEAQLTQLRHQNSEMNESRNRAEVQLTRVDLRLENLINQVQENYHTSSIIITHDLTCARHTADRVAMLLDGRVLRIGSFDDVFDTDDPRIKSFHDYNFTRRDSP